MANLAFRISRKPGVSFGNFATILHNSATLPARRTAQRRRINMFHMFFVANHTFWATVDVEKQARRTRAYPPV